MGEFSGKVVLVSGAGSGFGRRAALAFARAGASLALNDLTPIHLDETAAEAERIGSPVKSYLEDVAKRMPVQLLVDQVREDWGRVDALVMAASVRPADRVETMDEWDWHRTIDVNLTAPFLLLQGFAPLLRERSGGAVVAVGPVRSASDRGGLRPAYYASKVGLLGLVRAAAGELAEAGIRVNAVLDELLLGLAERQPQAAAVSAPQRFDDLVLWLCGP
ncbi:MAG TPA: SDR family NAD(P)-dependent oxidoreductase, partial [Anaerolineaceae bacterium]